MISAIAAIGKENRVIGNKGQIPWHISEDFKHFKETTMGHPMIMGRKTFETFKSPLPGRAHIVITRDKDYKVPEGVIVVTSIMDAIVEAVKQKGGEEIFVIGGGQIYELAMPFLDRLYLTLIEGDFEGDAFFPDYSEFQKEMSSRNSEEADFKYRFVALEN